MRSPLRHVVLAAVCCTACSLPSEQRPARIADNGANAAASQFVSAPCVFNVPARAEVRCGWLTVPEDRSRTNSRTVRLPVAIYRSRSARPAPDPILWLVGGPGGRAQVFASTLFERVVEPYLGKRDFIVLEIRGAGSSQPALACSDHSEPSERWLRACRERLSSIADLNYYRSSAVAADIADLRRALGLAEWNLLGESYGTRLALTAMRDHPEGLRAVVLDSVVPPEVDEYADGPAKFENALNALFAECRADPECAAAFPDLRSAFLRAADQLDRSPRRLAGVWHGTPFEVRFDGRQLMQAVHMALYESDLIPRVPRAIDHAVDGRADTLWREAIARHAIFVARKLVDEGAQLSFHCAEETPFTDVSRLRLEDALRPWMRHAASGIALVEACRVWNVRPAGPRESLPVRSEIPVLLLAGGCDPVTPPLYARSAASHLSHSHVFIFPGMGHQLTANSISTCPHTTVLEFLDNPRQRPKAACLARWKPRWILD